MTFLNFKVVCFAGFFSILHASLYRNAGLLEKSFCKVFNDRCVAASHHLKVKSTTIPCVDEEFAALYRNVGPQYLKAHAKRQGVLLSI